jgi:anti-sigma B factor antagonist
MEVKVEKNNDTINISVSGDIEMLSIKEFKNSLLGVGENENKDIELDLSKVNYIDSSGVGVLISLMKVQKSKSKNLKITKVSKKVEDVFKLSSLSDIFNI